MNKLVPKVYDGHLANILGAEYVCYHGWDMCVKFVGDDEVRVPDGNAFNVLPYCGFSGIPIQFIVEMSATYIRGHSDIEADNDVR